MQSKHMTMLKHKWKILHHQKWYFGIMYEYYNTSQHEITNNNYVREE